MREALKALRSDTLRTQGVLCPLHLPGRRTPGQLPATSRAELAQAIWDSLRLAGPVDSGWADKGEPANADFLLWVTADGRQHVLALEFSANTPASAGDCKDSLPHLMELLGHARRLESRGVFTRIGATLTGDRFQFSERIISHLTAFTTQDKPLYKLCQASSYATRFLQLMANRGNPLSQATAHAIAITNSGVEALRAQAVDA